MREIHSNLHHFFKGMKLKVRWRSGRGAAPELSPVELLTPETSSLYRLVQAAQGTPYYQQEPQADLIQSPLALASGLSELPKIELVRVLAGLRDFRSPTAGANPQRFERPLGVRGAVAVLDPYFQPEPGVFVFEPAFSRELAVCRAETLAGHAVTLRNFAHWTLSGHVSLPNVRRAIVAFSSLEGGLLTDSDRDLFWNAFQVPVYEQFLGLNSELLGSECAAHAGLHLKTDHALFEMDPAGGDSELVITSLRGLDFPVFRLATGLTGHIDDCPCSCGQTSPRIRSLAPLHIHRIGAASYAATPAR